jgi:drug/metabolite transporter (DMT)-like permease
MSQPATTRMTPLADASGTSGTWQMVLAMLLSGTIGLAVVESGQPPLVVVFYRCLIGGAALLVWLALTRAWVLPSWRDLAWVASGGLALVFNWLCLFSSYRYGSISVSTMVYHTQPFMLICLVSLVQGERFQMSKLPWLVVAFAGVVLITQAKEGGSASTLLGVALASAAAFFYAVATLITRRLKHLPPALIAALQMGIGTVVLLPLVAPDLGPMSHAGWVAVTTLGLVHTAFMYTIMYAAFQRLPSTSIALLSFIYPLVALLVDLVYFQVSLGALQAMGMAAIALALMAHQRQWTFGIAKPAS